MPWWEPLLAASFVVLIVVFVGIVLYGEHQFWKNPDDFDR